MGKKRRDDRPAQHRTRTKGHLRSVPTLADRPEDQPLIQPLRAALRESSPAALLMTVGGILEVATAGTEEPAVESLLGNLVDSFVGTDLRETTAALHVIAALVPDDVLRARIGKVLATRRQPVPAWVAALPSVEVRRAALLTHVLDDGHDVILEVVLGGDTFVVTVYIDFNVGTVVKDAF